MTIVSIYEAKTNFSKLIQLVEQGESVVVQKRGKTVAELSPPKNHQVSWAKLRQKYGHIHVPHDFDDTPDEVIESLDKDLTPRC